MFIRQEEQKDHAAVYALVKAAFETTEHTDKNEHNLVEKLRGSDGFINELCLVAEQDGEVVGHIVFTKARIGDTTALALAPLAVLPSFHRKGVGSALIEEGHRIAKSLGYDIIVVLGSEKYYPRFGYKPASSFGIKAPFEIPDKNYMAISLNKNTKRIDGVVSYVREMLD